jgi:hypothetical protein
MSHGRSFDFTLTLLAVAYWPLWACQSSSDSTAPADQRPPTGEARPAVSSGGAPQSGAPAVNVPARGVPQVTESVLDQRPSNDMGRGFQGTLNVRLRAPSGDHSLRYLTRGNTARLQVDRVAGNAPAAKAGSNLDVMIWDKNIATLDHEQRTYRTSALEQVKAADEADSNIEINKTGERLGILGVICEQYQITDGPLRVSACVSPLPGTFDVGKFETVSGVDVPAWAERLLDEQMLPLRASVTDARGQELYSLELVEYSPGPVDDSMLALPAAYRAAEEAGEARR